ncbi:MAG TPA: GGDEF domain-containing protein [Desulfosporosinus sp.]|nr:GGDEF domain-containing protein [Desulfosporosinus sp.]
MAIKRTIPSITKAIQEAEDNANMISMYENIIVSMYASVLLYLASIVNFIVRYLIQTQNLEICLFNSLLFLLMGIVFDVVTRVDLKTNVVTLSISGLSFLTLIFITTRFYDIIGPAVWTVSFILLLLAMIRITREMLYSLTLAILISNIYILYHSFSASSFHMEITYYVIQIVLFMIVCIIAAMVHKINTNRYYWITKQFQEVKRKNEEITSIYKEITSSEHKIKHLAYHDHLTGLPNRLFLSEQLNHAIFSSSRIKKCLQSCFWI